VSAFTWSLFGLLATAVAAMLGLAGVGVTWIRDGFSEGIVLLGMLDGLLAWLLKVLVVNYVQRWRRRIA